MFECFRHDVWYLIQDTLSELKVLQTLFVYSVDLSEFGLNGSFLFRKNIKLLIMCVYNVFCYIINK